MVIFAGLVILWLLATLMVNLKMEGERRSRLTGLFRIFLLLTIMGMGMAFRLGAVPLEEPLFLVFTAELTLCGYFFASEFVLYWKNRDAESAKKAIQTAAVSQVGMIFLLGIALLYRIR